MEMRRLLLLLADPPACEMLLEDANGIGLGAARPDLCRSGCVRSRPSRGKPGEPRTY